MSNTTDNMFKSMGWTVCCSPITGELYIYRADMPGQILVRHTPDGYEAELWDDTSDVLVDSATAKRIDLFVPEQA